MKRINQIAVASIVSCCALSAQAGVITFEGHANGLDIESTATPFFNLSGGITSLGPNLGAALFDSTPNVNPLDPDLWVGTGNVLMLQSEDSPGKTGNIWNNPNDEADGGTLIFDFDVPATPQFVDLIDINGNGFAIVSLFDSTGGSRIYDVPDEWTGDIAQGDPGIGTLNLTTLDPQAGFMGTFATATDNGLNLNDVIRMEVFFSGSAALDNLNLNLTPPAPSTLAVLLIGAIGAGRRRRA